MNDKSINQRLTSAQRLATSASPQRRARSRLGLGELNNSSPVPQPPAPLPLGMTLIELMVVVVILTTLVAGVLPLISPNNDTRKIREGARGLKTFLMMAQAEAARTGRPVGIGFRESSSDSGVALEAYQLTVPPPFGGFSPDSRMGVTRLTGTTSTYPNVAGAQAKFSRTRGFKMNTSYSGTDFAGAQLYEVDSRLATLDANNNIQPQMLPPQMFRVGDVIHIDGMRFMIVDDSRNSEIQFPAGSKQYFLESSNYYICVWLDEVGQGRGKVPPMENPNTNYRYLINRQPAGGASASPFTIGVQPSYQFPAGIAIDLNASGYELAGAPEFFLDGPSGSPFSAGIMFSPNGSIQSIWINGYPITNADRIFLLVGRGENGAVTTLSKYDKNCDWYVNPQASNDELKEKQGQINWLNPESRWLMLEPAGNRIQVVQNALVDPRSTAFSQMMNQFDRPKPLDYKTGQIELAHELAHGHGQQGASN